MFKAMGVYRAEVVFTSDKPMGICHFIFVDSEDRWDGSTSKPSVNLSECRETKLTPVSQFVRGLFISWMLPSCLDPAV